MDTYTNIEMMAIAAGRLVSVGDILFAGTGISMLAAALARRINHGKSVIFFETGGIDPSLEEMPLAVGDPRVMTGACLNAGLVDAFSFLANPKLKTVAFLGAAQIDPYGNLNSTAIGDYHHPKARLPGSGGACDAAGLAAAVIIFMQHDKKRFVEKLDYLTSPGWLQGGDSRTQAGYKRGGPVAVVTNLGLMKFEEQSKRMYLAAYYPGVELDYIAQNTGFSLDMSRAELAPPPTDRELSILRREVDPMRLILG